jgi:hypothetical protein
MSSEPEGGQAVLNQIWTWGIIVVGYTVPSLLLGLGLHPAGSVIERWGRSASSLS